MLKLNMEGTRTGRVPCGGPNYSNPPKPTPMPEVVRLVKGVNEFRLLPTEFLPPHTILRHFFGGEGAFGFICPGKSCPACKIKIGHKYCQTLFPVVRDDTFCILAVTPKVTEHINSLIREDPLIAGFGRQNTVLVHSNGISRYSVTERCFPRDSGYDLSPEELVGYIDPYMRALSAIAQGPDDATLQKIMDKIRHDHGELCLTERL